MADKKKTKSRTSIERIDKYEDTDTKVPPRKRIKREDYKSNKKAKFEHEGGEEEKEKKENAVSTEKKKLQKFSSSSNNNFFSFVKNRCLGQFKYPTVLTTKMYNSICKADVRKPADREMNIGHGAIFNLEFSPDNRCLLAACEQNDVLVYDPCNQKKVHVLSNAHKEGVNCINFLDTNLFATCSDDKTVAIWDIRNLKSKVFTLVGHTSWVKSINYDKSSGYLISSAFDDTVRFWDLKKMNNSVTIKSKKILNVPFLTRTKMTSYDDEEPKLFVATTTGLLFVIHNLNLDTVRKDTREDMQNIVMNYNSSIPLVKPVKKRRANVQNQIEFIQSFPSDSKPWCIASVQLHPKKNFVLSRYTNQRADSEWSVVHSLKTSDQDEDSESLPSYKLQSYIEEPNLSPGYIKELCYSQDGRVICSPFGNSIRLLAFNENCDDGINLCKPQQLTELKLITSHNFSVLTTRFSPCMPIVASGCLGGQVSFHQPRM